MHQVGGLESTNDLYSLSSFSSRSNLQSDKFDAVTSSRDICKPGLNPDATYRWLSSATSVFNATVISATIGRGTRSPALSVRKFTPTSDTTSNSMKLMNPIAVLGNASLTGFFTGIFEPAYPTGVQPPNKPKTNNGRTWHHCMAAECVPCEVSPQSCVVHKDCLQVFIRNCTTHDALDRLWVARVWRRQLWVGMHVPELNLLRTDKILGSEVPTLLDYAERRGLPQLKVLPLELVGIIHKLLQGHLFWRYLAIVHMTRQFSIAPSQPLQSFPLRTVASWERGGMPKLAAGRLDDLPPTICLTLDVDGLRAFERLPERPTFEPRRFNDLAFIVDEQTRHADTVAHFKVP